MIYWSRITLGRRGSSTIVEENVNAPGSVVVIFVCCGESAGWIVFCSISIDIDVRFPK